jgi:hypothetical protein
MVEAAGVEPASHFMSGIIYIAPVQELLPDAAGNLWIAKRLDSKSCSKRLRASSSRPWGCG